MHISSVHPPYDVRIFEKECTTLAEAGYRVSYVVPHDRTERINNVDIIPIRSAAARLTRILLGPWRALVTARKVGGDVFHLHDPELLPVALLLKMLGARVIVDVHEDLAAQILSKPWIPRLLRPPVGLITATLQRIVGRYVDAVITATPKIAEGLAGCKPLVVQNFPKLQELQLELSETILSRSPAFLYLGGITRIRGAREMIEAIDKVPAHCNAELWLAGRFESEELRCELESLPGWARTRYLGQVDRNAVNRLLAGASAGLVLFHPEPNHIHSQPTKLFEYLSAGIPAIASDFGHWSNTLDLADCGMFVDPMNPDAIAEAMASLLGDVRGASEMGRIGRRKVEEKFTWEIEARKLKKLYAEIV